MIVWQDKSCSSNRRRPEWEDDARFATIDCHGGNLWTQACYAPQLGWRDNVKWYDAGDNWRVAQYLPFEPQRWMRPLDHALFISVKDVGGEVWPIPAILRPEGVPAIGMRHRAEIVDGKMVWVQDAPTLRSQRALDACLEIRPYAERQWEGADADMMRNAMLAILEAGFYLPAQTVAVLGLMGSALLDKGLQIACGVINEQNVEYAINHG